MNLSTKLEKLEREIIVLSAQQEKINTELERIINLHSQILAALQIANAKLEKGKK